jgi:hypothetical protein
MTKITDKNDVTRDMTAEEQAEFDQLVQNQQALYQAEQDAKTAKETAQASGNTKLLDLGLSQAEATALTGYTPPVAE